MSRRGREGEEGAVPLRPRGGGVGSGGGVPGHLQMSRCCRCRVGAMSKVELAGRPEPGYESMEQFTVSVEHVAEMLRTIDFQPGEGAREGPWAAGTGCPDPLEWGTGRREGQVRLDGQRSRDTTSRGSSFTQALPGRRTTTRWCLTEKRAARGRRKSGWRVSVAPGA